MPSSLDTNPLYHFNPAAPAPAQAAVRAHDKENPFAPAMVSQEETGPGAASPNYVFNDGAVFDGSAGCRSTSPE